MVFLDLSGKADHYYLLFSGRFDIPPEALLPSLRHLSSHSIFIQFFIGTHILVPTYPELICPLKIKLILYCSRCNTVNCSKNLTQVLHISFLDDFTFRPSTVMCNFYHVWVYTKHDTYTNSLWLFWYQRTHLAHKCTKWLEIKSRVSKACDSQLWWLKTETLGRVPGKKA